MKLDNTLTRIIDTIREEIKVKFNVELSNQEIVEVVQTQIEVTKQGLSKGISVTWYRFCKFIYSDRYKRKSEVIKKLSEIDIDFEGKSPEEIQRIKEELIIRKAEEKRAYLAKGKEQTVGITAEEVKNTDSVNKVNLVLFKPINSKHSK